MFSIFFSVNFNGLRSRGELLIYSNNFLCLMVCLHGYSIFDFNQFSIYTSDLQYFLPYYNLGNYYLCRELISYSDVQFNQNFLVISTRRSSRSLPEHPSLSCCVYRHSASLYKGLRALGPLSCESAIVQFTCICNIVTL